MFFLVSSIFNDFKHLDYNNFLRNYNRHNSTHCFQRSEKYNRSVHYSINSIRSWDVNTKYFIAFDIFRKFDLVNKNRLKNIFHFILGDDLIWLVASV